MCLVGAKKVCDKCGFKNARVYDARLHYCNYIITIFVLNPYIDVFTLKLFVTIFMLNLIIIIGIFTLKLYP